MNAESINTTRVDVSIPIFSFRTTKLALSSAGLIDNRNRKTKSYWNIYRLHREIRTFINKIAETIFVNTVNNEIFSIINGEEKGKEKRTHPKLYEIGCFCFLARDSNKYSSVITYLMRNKNWSERYAERNHKSFFFDNRLVLLALFWAFVAFMWCVC